MIEITAMIGVVVEFHKLQNNWTANKIYPSI